MLTIISFSCESKDNITVYQIKKSAPNKTDKTISKLKWTPPKNWIEKESGEMRLTSFDAFDSNNKTVDISISIFPGDVGGIENNVNNCSRENVENVLNLYYNELNNIDPNPENHYNTMVTRLNLDIDLIQKIWEYQIQFLDSKGILVE